MSLVMTISQCTRGGERCSNILDFERDYPEAKVVKLEQNCRSTQTILDAANAVVANNASRKAKACGLPETRRADRVFAASDEYAEARFVVSEIERHIDGGFAAGDLGLLQDERPRAGRWKTCSCVRASLPGRRRGQVLRTGRDQRRPWPTSR